MAGAERSDAPAVAQLQSARSRGIACALPQPPGAVLVMFFVAWSSTVHCLISEPRMDYNKGGIPAVFAAPRQAVTGGRRREATRTSEKTTWPSSLIFAPNMQGPFAPSPLRPEPQRIRPTSVELLRVCVLTTWIQPDGSSESPPAERFGLTGSRTRRGAERTCRCRSITRTTCRAIPGRRSAKWWFRLRFTPEAQNCPQRNIRQHLENVVRSALITSCASNGSAFTIVSS